ncbi:MerR family transcriptional regulator [Paeniglutamicibacter gangotriensis]|uniref:Nitrogen metabolism transcriptional regulator n=1 Tax=Paeniglutamicibacter gangotriensis Lz1y TaxID=1276920 RepID=M7MNX6_9MICC|nr:MerR family transcriptional regulator [Paeniglutamicibacter gangotriensis]EMQ96650.1 nitrogen metabolism transcriptional regulator [Paeniglutamicibacter gangotriensis Lz1y]
MTQKRSRDLAVYGISVAAELVGTGQQNLRLYERKGLLDPQRTEGGTRRYSEEDLDILRRISHLLAQGLNLSGIGLVLSLEAENASLRSELERQDSQQGKKQKASES